jgi:RNA polymerase sigma-70 factor (ECF subfamily)
VECYQRRVYALVGRMLAPRGLDALTADVAQETFLRVFRHLDRFKDDGRARLSTWILTIATRLSIDAIRRAQRPRPVPAEAAPSLRPDQTHERRARLAAAQAAIAQLPPEQQAVLVLRAYHDLDYPEIAAALDLAPGTVKSRLARARARLRQAIGEPA